jgi:hypothetical protein
VDAFGNVYVADQLNNRVQKFTYSVAVEKTTWGRLKTAFTGEPAP